MKDRDFKRIKIPGGGPYSYVHTFDGFSVLIEFFKDRFNDDFVFHAGCYFDDCEYGDATIRVTNLPSNTHKLKNGFSLGLYYGELTEEQFLRCLDEMFDKYLKPYYEKGKEYLKEIILNEHTLFGEGYTFSKGARGKINKMFGLNTVFKIHRD